MISASAMASLTVADSLTPSIRLVAELDQRFAAFEHGQHSRPRGRDKSTQTNVGRVAARHEDHLRRWTALIQEFDEVSVLRDDDRLGGARGREDLEVRGPMKVEVANGGALNRQRRSHPQRECGWQLIVEPECHAATMG